MACTSKAERVIVLSVRINLKFSIFKISVLAQLENIGVLTVQ